MPVSFVFAYAHPVAQRYRHSLGEYQKYLFLLLYGNTENPLDKHTVEIQQVQKQTCIQNTLQQKKQRQNAIKNLNNNFEITTKWQPQ